MKTSEMSVKTFEFTLSDVQEGLNVFQPFEDATLANGAEVTWTPIFDPADKAPFTTLIGLQATVTVRTEQK